MMLLAFIALAVFVAVLAPLLLLAWALASLFPKMWADE